MSFKKWYAKNVTANDDNATPSPPATEPPKPTAPIAEPPAGSKPNAKS